MLLFFLLLYFFNRANTSVEKTFSSFYIEFTKAIKKDIEGVFIAKVKPEVVLTVFHKYNDKVLTNIDFVSLKKKNLC